MKVPYPTQAGQVGGHEGVGIVQKLGPGSENSHVKVGDRVGIKVSSSQESKEACWIDDFQSGLHMRVDLVLFVSRDVMVFAS